MSYACTNFNVMIASPGDVAAERAIARDVIYEWNAVHSYARKIVLLPIGWESHSSPEMGAPAQSIINQQVLAKCDLLVGIFWTRIGTPTERHLSGTVEEIEEHIAAGQPAMLYFSSQPVAIDTADLGQLARVKEFKGSCQQRGLYESYDNHNDFRTKFYRHLQLKINEHPLFSGIKSEDGFGNIVESRTSIAKLSHEAKILLKEASKDPHGMIIYVRFVNGTAIQINGKNLIPTNTRREISKWENALAELQRHEYIVAKGTNGESFEISNLGFQIADMIAL